MGEDVLLHDHFAERLQNIKGASAFDLSLAVTDIYVLNRLKPLIKAGIIKFSPTRIRSCERCLSEFEKRVTALSEEVTAKYQGSLHVERNSDGTFTLDASTLFNPPMNLYSREKNDDVDSFVHGVIYETVRSALWDARDASNFGGAVFSNSPLAMTALMTADSTGRDREEVRFVEGMAASRLPWISELTVEQILILREEAALALPRLREFLARHLSVQDNAKPAAGEDYISELREQAEEVRAEFMAIRNRRSSFQRGTIGWLSLGIATAGVATGVMPPVVGATQLLTTLGLLHNANDKDHTSQDELRGRPGFVLVAAQQILAHAKSK